MLPLNSKAIPLSQGKFAIVDAEDYEWISQWHWSVMNRGYAVRSQHIAVINGKQKKKAILMHRLIANTPDGMGTDHINGDRLDNRRANLRICTISQNNCNKKPIIGTSNYKGVCWDSEKKKWKAQISINNHNKVLGRFLSEEDAAKAYDIAATFYYGEYARINAL